MDEPISSVPSPEIIPQASAPPNFGPVREATPQSPLIKKQTIPPFFILLGVCIVIVVGSILFASQQRINTKPAVTPTPTNVPLSPTSSMVLTPIATESAFINFEAEIDKLPSTIQGAALQDQTILPPVLDLPLGFSN